MKAILRDTFESTWKSQITEASIRNYLDTEIGGEIAGLIHGVDDLVDALHVSSDFQRRGVGRRLMERAEQDMVARGLRQARLETGTFNEQSESFYKSLGYVEMGRYPDEECKSGLTTVLFEKRL